MAGYPGAHKIAPDHPDGNKDNGRSAGVHPASQVKRLPFGAPPPHPGCPKWWQTVQDDSVKSLLPCSKLRLVLSAWFTVGTSSSTFQALTIGRAVEVWLGVGDDCFSEDAGGAAFEEKL